MEGNRWKRWGAWIPLIAHIQFFCKACCSTFKMYQEVTELSLSHSLLPIPIFLASHHKASVACFTSMSLPSLSLCRLIYRSQFPFQNWSQIVWTPHTNCPMSARHTYNKSQSALDSWTAWGLGSRPPSSWKIASNFWLPQTTNSLLLTGSLTNDIKVK